MQRKSKIKYCPTSLSYRNLGLLYSVQNAELYFFQVVWVLLSLFGASLGGKQMIQASSSYPTTPIKITFLLFLSL